MPRAKDATGAKVISYWNSPFAPGPSFAPDFGIMEGLTLARAGRVGFVEHRAMTSADANLYLVGFMGTGKSTVGRQVAKQLGFRFLDSDHEIERLQGKPVSR